MSKKNSNVVPEIVRYIYAILTIADHILCETRQNNRLFTSIH